MVSWFTVKTNYRTFKVQAAGIGAAIESALEMLMARQGEYLREVTQ